MSKKTHLQIAIENLIFKRAAMDAAIAELEQQQQLSATARKKGRDEAGNK